MIICLINPNLDGSPIPNLGLAYVISSIEKDHRIRLLDMSFHTRGYERYVLDNLKQDKPDVIGFSVTSFSFHYALKIASLIRNLYPDVPLVYGGVHPTLLPEETIQNPLVDAICIGEGEDSFKEYLDKLQNNQEPRGVKGIWYKDKSGNIIRNPLRPFIEDLDSIPFPNWDYWEMERYIKLNESFVGGLRHLTSRGCPYSCTFCSNPAIRKAVPGKFYRLRSPENVIEEIRLNVDKYYRKGFRHVAFGDEVFGLDLEHLNRLCLLYIKEGFSEYLSWGCQTRAETITEEWARIASNAGCAMVGLGIESGDENIRVNIYNKKITNRQIMRAVTMLRRNNIMYCISIMIGCPEDSRKSIKKSFKLAKDIKPVGTYFIFYKPLPETELFKSINTAINYAKNDYWRSWNIPKMTTKFLNKLELKMFVIQISILRFYNFFIQGVKLRKIRFLWDVLRYILRLDNNRIVALNSPYIISDIEAKILYKYILEDWKKRYLKSIV